MTISPDSHSLRFWRAGLIAFAGLCLATSQAQAQQSFASPDEAAAALVAAVKSGEKADMVKVLGAAGEDIVDSGDAVADADTRHKFTTSYEAQHSIKVEGKKATLIIGGDDFSFPIPLIKTKAGWEFDTAEGRKEVLYRRIGRNELDTIQTCLAFVDAQNEYSEKDHGDGVGAYAQRIVSSPGKQDGLYWKSDANDSPLGAVAAEAAAEGYNTGGEPQPYHGYYYRILTGQGQSAAGGALSYVIKGKMIGGFGLVAWPAEYGNSGVMTFIVNHSGVVYQKDLGKDTEAAARRMTWFDPDRSWTKVEQPKP
jgi:Protein of unknown function (DUF2950)